MLLCRWTDQTFAPSWVPNKKGFRPLEPYQAWVNDGCHWIGAPELLTTQQVKAAKKEAKDSWATFEAGCTTARLKHWMACLEPQIREELLWDCGKKLMRTIVAYLHPVSFVAPPNTTAARPSVGIDLATMAALCHDAAGLKAAMSTKQGRPVLEWTFTSLADLLQLVKIDSLDFPARFYELTGGQLVRATMDVSKELPLR
jgi:hypothetical protein